jgi:hypothetical protein
MNRLVEITNKVITLINAENVTPLERAAVLELLGTFTRFQRCQQLDAETQLPPPRCAKINKGKSTS